MDSNEHAIYRAALQGDRDAFEMIIRSFSRSLFAIAYGILQNREEAEDVVQDTLVKAWKSRWRVRDPEKFPAWISTIARHRARDLARRRRPEPLPHDFESPEPKVKPENADLESEVQAALSQLPELHRAAVTLRYFEELDYATIERTLGLSNGALRGISAAPSGPCAANSNPPWRLAPDFFMPTIHEQIDELLAADLHGELSAAERDAFHAHLLDCADCRQAFQEEKNMHKVLNETLADKKADTGFEQRMVSRFRDRVPQRPGLVQLVMNLVRLRAVQLTAAAALLLSMVQLGGVITGESPLRSPSLHASSSVRESLLAKSPTAKADTRGRGADQFASTNSAPAAGVLAPSSAPPPPQDKASAPEPQTEATTERVITTGSYIPSAESESALPVSAYSADALNAPQTGSLSATRRPNSRS